MKHYKYLIIGGGLAGDAATRGIRELDPDGTIGMLSMESDPPYMRPNLSKGLWKGRPVEKIWRKTQERGTELHLNCQVTQIEPDKKTVRDNGNEECSPRRGASSVIAPTSTRGASSDVQVRPYSPLRDVDTVAGAEEVPAGPGDLVGLRTDEAPADVPPGRSAGNGEGEGDVDALLVPDLIFIDGSRRCRTATGRRRRGIPGRGPSSPANRTRPRSRRRGDRARRVGS